MIHRGRVLLAGTALLLASSCGVKATTVASSGSTPGGAAGTTTAVAPTTAAPTTAPATTTTEPAAGTPLAGARARVIAAYRRIGLTQAQSSCLADHLLADLAGSGQLPVGNATKYLVVCKISLADLGLGGNRTVREALIRDYMLVGMTRAQAACAVDKVLAAGLQSSSLDVTATARYFRACGFTPPAGN